MHWSAPSRNACHMYLAGCASGRIPRMDRRPGRGISVVLVLTSVLVAPLLAACASSTGAATTEIGSCQAVHTFALARAGSGAPVIRSDRPALFTALTRVAENADNAYVRDVARDLTMGKGVSSSLGTAVTQH